MVIVDPIEPHGPLQSIYDYLYQKALFFNHRLTVKHSQQVIQQSLKQQLFYLGLKQEYQEQYVFDNFEELENFYIDDFGNSINWTIKSRDSFRSYLRRKIVWSGRGKLVLDDWLVIYDLRKKFMKCQF